MFFLFFFISCKSVDPNAKGCSPVTGGVPVTDIQVDIDPDRELEKIHSLFLAHMDKLDALQGMCLLYMLVLVEKEGCSFIH